MREVKFIGGPLDGTIQRVEVGRYVVNVPIYRPEPLDPARAPDPYERLTMEHVVYREQRYRGGTTDFRLFVLDGIGHDEVMARLIGNYNGSGERYAVKAYDYRDRHIIVCELGRDILHEIQRLRMRDGDHPRITVTLHDPKRPV